MPGPITKKQLDFINENKGKMKQIYIASILKICPATVCNYIQNGGKQKLNIRPKRIKQIITEFSYKVLTVEPTAMNFKGTDSSEPYCCSVFGCGKMLSHNEILFGNKCQAHSKSEKIDVSKFISFPIKNAV